MCLILIAYRASSRYPLVIAANRDEAYARPALPAERWTDAPGVYGGRDMEAGGGWLAISVAGRYAALTNFREGGRRDSSLQTRGALVADYVRGEAAPLAYLEQVHQRRTAYNGFSMLAGDADDLYFYSNRGNGVRKVAPGVHGLSNHLLDEPWPKVVNGCEYLRAWLGLEEERVAARLYEYLGDRSTAPDHLLPATGMELQRERELSATFIAAERYGTRASSVVIVRADGETYFGERAYGPYGQPLYAKELRFSVTSAHDRRAHATTPLRDGECPPP